MLVDIGYATSDPRSPLGPYRFDQRPTGREDVGIDVKASDRMVVDGVRFRLVIDNTIVEVL
ncbi:MAG TPA: hypothetical protein VGC37_17110 [Friedmanniella sp.]